MTIFWILGAVVVVGGIGAFFANMSAQTTSSNMQDNFRRLGDVTGKSRADIERMVGQPQNVGATPGGGLLLQWIQVHPQAGYHYAIAFDPDGKAIGYTTQAVSQP